VREADLAEHSILLREATPHIELTKSAEAVDGRGRGVVERSDEIGGGEMGRDDADRDAAAASTWPSRMPASNSSLILTSWRIGQPLSIAPIDGRLVRMNFAAENRRAFGSR